jgi:putative aminophosphonate oxidoreductase
VRSLWLQEALARPGEEDAPRLEGTTRADVCIVGGGFTGLWTALRLKELDPAVDVALVESDICGGGASGRNGGFVLSWWSKIATMKKMLGGEEALRLARASTDAVAEIGRFCAEHGIDAQYRHDGWLWAATSGAQVGAWKETLAAADALGEQPFRRLEGDEAARLAGSPTHLTGVFEQGAATVQPALLARGLRRVALEWGMRIFERSAMTALDRGRPPRVRTDAGSVTADCVVLAMNAWVASVRELRRTLVVMASDMVATAPIPETLAEIGWTNGMCISDSRLLVNYYRLTHDGRLAWGKGGGTIAFGGRVGSAFEGESPCADDVAARLRFVYPRLREVPITHSWTGPIDRNATALPYFGGLGGRENILYGYGFSGNGVGPSVVAGRILASRALRRDDEWAAAGFPPGPTGLFPRNRAGAFPPEPARYLGGLVVRGAVSRKEDAENLERRPGRLVSRLAALAPAGLVPTRDAVGAGPVRPH